MLSLRSIIYKRDPLKAERFRCKTSEIMYYNDRFEPGESRFKKVLVANRGEVACRIFHTCKRLGIQTVAVYSEADSGSRFVKMADEAICIGPPSLLQSYLSPEAILTAVKRTNAQAVHPGYGFLSENPNFADLLEAAGVSFVGPRSEVIRLMGDKIESKRIAASVGIPFVPWHDGEVKDTSEALKIAQNLGYPLVVKASCGGGGRGLRVVHNDVELVEALRNAREEAQSAFGSGGGPLRLLMERAILSDGTRHTPLVRHIEVQVLGDRHGNVVHLGTRDCSLQIRHQKVIEEAGPPDVLVPSLGHQLCEAALRLVRAVGYDSAGTVEFLVVSGDSSEDQFYFLEMNTRLQVEHTVTEAVTGVDIVHQMLRIAKGHRLLYKGPVTTTGWAVESRVCAEQGRGRQVKVYKEPTHLVPGIRVDSGVEEGCRLPPVMLYDSLLCKLVALGGDREEALRRLTMALDAFVLRGIVTNMGTLRRILEDDDFLRGKFGTDHLSRLLQSKRTEPSAEEVLQMFALVAVIYVKEQLRNYSNRHSPKSFALVVTTSPDIGRTEITVDILDDAYKVRLEGDSPRMLLRVPASAFGLADDVIRFGGAGNLYQRLPSNSMGEFHIRPRAGRGVVELKVQSAKAAALEATVCSRRQRKEMQARHPHVDRNSNGSVGENVDSVSIRAPLPGLVTCLHVTVGQKVEAGQEVCVLEAMKMRNCLVAPADAMVKAVHIETGQFVREGALIVEFE